MKLLIRVWSQYNYWLFKILGKKIQNFTKIKIINLKYGTMLGKQNKNWSELYMNKIYLWNEVPEGILFDEISGFAPEIINGNLELVK